MRQLKRSFSLLEVIICLMIGSVAMAPLIMAPHEEIALVQKATNQFFKRLAIDNSLVEAVALVAKGHIELGSLEDIPATSNTIAIGKTEYTLPIEYRVLDQDHETAPQTALISVQIKGDDKPLKEIELCIIKKK